MGPKAQKFHQKAMQDATYAYAYAPAHTPRFDAFGRNKADMARRDEHWFADDRERNQMLYQHAMKEGRRPGTGLLEF